MKLLFLDETGSAKDPKFYGICGVVIDAAKYGSISRDFGKRMEKSGWSEEHEFKGRFLFSRSKGDPKVSIDDRIALAREIVALNMAKKNAKLKAVFAWNKEGDSVESHLRLIEAALKKLLPSEPVKTVGKHLCVVFVDEKQKVHPKELREQITKVLLERGYLLVEDVVILKSSFEHVGLCYADLIGYLASWICLNPDIDSAQRSIFKDEGLSEQDALKLKTVREILSTIKSIGFTPKLGAST